MALLRVLKSGDALLNQRGGHGHCDEHTDNDGNPCILILRFLHETDMASASDKDVPVRA